MSIQSAEAREGKHTMQQAGYVKDCVISEYINATVNPINSFTFLCFKYVMFLIVILFSICKLSSCYFSLCWIEQKMIITSKFLI